MAVTLIDRRLDERRGPVACRVTHATLRPGTHVQIINLSPGGALIESDRQLRPGGRVHVRLVTSRRIISLAAHILRCIVSALDPEKGVTYRGALRFDERCHQLAESFVEEAVAVGPDG